MVRRRVVQENFGSLTRQLKRGSKAPTFATPIGALMAARVPLGSPRAFHWRRARASRDRGPPPLRVVGPEAASLAADSSVALVSYVLSDFIAQKGEVARPTCDEWDTLCVEPLEQGQMSVNRLRRFAAFGALDGVISHYWYRWLDDAASGWPSLIEITTNGVSSANDASFVSVNTLTDTAVTQITTTDAVSRTVEMVAADMLVFSPWWCALFLSSMAAMSHWETKDSSDESKTVNTTLNAINRRLTSSWKQLYMGDLLVWIPLNGMLYGLVPVDHRVQAFGVINLLYTAVLSFWAERVRKLERAADLGIDVPSGWKIFGSNNVLSKSSAQTDRTQNETSEKSVEEV